jgi:hypothetical protein
VKNTVLPHGASSKEKALLAIHPCSSEQGILAFSRKPTFWGSPWGEQWQGSGALKRPMHLSFQVMDAWCLPISLYVSFSSLIRETIQKHE